MHPALPAVFLAVAAPAFAGPAPSPRSEVAETVHAAFGTGDPSALATALDAAASTDLDQALELAAEHSLAPAIVAGRWRPDPAGTEAAFHTVLAAPASSYQQHLLLGIVHAWVKRDAVRPRSVIGSLPESPDRAELQTHYRQALLRFRPADAFQLALEERDLPQGIRLDTAARAFAKSDRPSASEALAALPPEDTAAQRTLAKAVAAQWALESAPDASAWARTLASDATREIAHEEIAYAWSAADPSAASSWALALPPGKPRDSALRTLVFRTAHTAPADAFRAALEVSDPAVRETVLFTAVNEWGRTAPDQARSALERAPGIPPDLKTRLKSDLP